ncbi:MAG TPA: lipopolysaccharide heptosyltransferase II, partial [Gammaproteobacteria bacterium]|nr:lipopolysaccharide heptosyltransferase II [Gammaproteobacteria bacterium]
MNTPIRQVLIVGPSWVGDMVMAQSLFRVLKQRHPAIHIDVLAPAWSRPLLTRMPEVRNALELPLRHGELRLTRRYQLGRSLRTSGYEWSIVLPNSFKSALVPFWARIPQRTGYVGELRLGVLNDVRRLDKARLPMTVQRFMTLGLPPGDPLPGPPFPTPHLTVEAAAVVRSLERLGLRPAARLLALCPGAEFGPAK